MAKRFTKEELIAFINRANNKTQLRQAEAVIAKMRIPEAWREEIEMELLGSWDMMNDPGWYSEPEYEDYGPSNPWDAPGMRVSDFIRGVSYC